MAQTYFRYDPDETENENSKTYELTDRFMLTELVWVTKNLELDLSEMGPGTQMFVGAFLVMRRHDGKQKWGIREFERLSTNNLDFMDSLPEKEEEVPDETPDPTAGSVGFVDPGAPTTN